MGKSMKDVRYTIIVPVYDEQDVISESYKKLKQTADSLNETYEIIFINDGSRDNTQEIIQKICIRDKNVKLINFSRNFGHQVAISAGMDFAEGQAVIIIDADLQDPPELIPLMIKKWKEGFDVVYGRRTSRKGECFFKKITAFLFYRFLRMLTDVDIPADTGDFRLIDRKVCDVMTEIKERNRFVRGLVSWAGFRQTSVEYVRNKRFAGKTKYPVGKMIRFAANAIISFSYKPLRTATFLGFLLSISGFGYFIFVIYQRLFTDNTVEGWTSIISINLIFFGIVLIILGIIGEYVGRIYDESKNRPLYIVKSATGLKKKSRNKHRL
jgi:polyisoprenyl-phosphate glycosyltransferase